MFDSSYWIYYDCMQWDRCKLVAWIQEYENVMRYLQGPAQILLELLHKKQLKAHGNLEKEPRIQNEHASKLSDQSIPSYVR